MEKNTIGNIQKLKQEEKQKIKINSKQINLVNLLKKSNEEVEEYLLNEEKNNEYIIIPKKQNKNIPTKIPEQETLGNIKEMCINKINNSRYKQKEILVFLVENIDNRGFLSMSDIKIKNEISEILELNVSFEEINKNIKILQSFLPLYMGVRNETEYKKKQVQNLKEKDNLYEIIDKFEKGITKKNYVLLEKKYGKKNFKKYVTQYLCLKNYPLEDLKENEKKEINSIDFCVSTNADGTLIPEIKKLEININKNINEEDIKSNYSGEYREYLLKKYKFTKELVQNLKKRNEYNEKIINFLIKKQNDFFLSGNINYLKPLTYKDISIETGISISTISRIIAGKKIQTDFGIIPLKNLFSRKVQKNRNISIVQTCEKIKDIVSKYKNISDDEIRKILNKENITISRRTVANYRKKYNISNSYFRDIVEDLKKNVFNK